MCTTIGTSTNLLVVAVAADLGLARLGMFDFALPAAFAAGGGVIYLWLVAPRLLPRRETPMGDLSPRVFAAQVRLADDSACVDQSLSEAVRKTDGQLRVRRIKRGEGTFVMPFPDAVLRGGDRLLISDTRARLTEFERALDATLFSGDIADVVLRTGDVLLVQGSSEQIAALKQENELLVLDATSDVPTPEKRRLIQKPTGLRYKLVNGVVTFEGNECTGALPGAFSRRLQPNPKGGNIARSHAKDRQQMRRGSGPRRSHWMALQQFHPEADK